MKKTTILVAVLAFACPLLAQTPDLNLGGAGARAIGMGGAFVSIADDATAVYWNPAGLAQLKKPEVTLVGYHGRWVDAHKWDYYPKEVSLRGGFDIGSYKLNFASFALPLNPGGRNLVLGTSVHMIMDGTAGSDFTNVRDNDTELQVEEARGGLYQYSGFAAYEVNKYLLVGAGAGVMKGSLHEQEVVYMTRTSFAPEEYIEERTEAEMIWESGVIFSGGLLVRPLRALKVGVMYRTKAPTTVTPGKLMSYVDDTNDQSNSYPWQEVVDEEESSTELDFPAVYAGGISYRVNDQLTLACDYQLHKWSEAKLKDEDGNQLMDGGRPLLIAFDSKQVRLGMEYLFETGGRPIPVRLGYYRYNTPVPDWFQEQLRGFYGEDEDADGVDQDGVTYPVRSTPRNFFTAGIGIVTPIALIDTALEYSKMHEEVFRQGLNASLERKVLKVYLSVIAKFDIPGLGEE